MDYPASFPLARSLARHLHFHLGPTNSGKTYEALQHLQRAASGLYLAPLRLLAMEVRDRLMDMGVSCNLITGEERVMVPGARHTACTVEMMHPGQQVDVAVIDEIQMLQDERGAAWTAALVGVPAKEVYICGSNAVTEICTAAVEAMGEHYDITYLERKTPLLLEEHSLCGARYNRWRLKGKLHEGDAIIAFSRKDVLTLAARIRQWGWRVATIYGALSPEVRRTESRRFASGEADILVATDAIGMGLNLPIRRVVFTTLHKFDGVANRGLTATETRQIAGRAGRYGLYPTGYVTACEDDEMLQLQHLLTTSDEAGLMQLPVAVTWQRMAETSKAIHTSRLAELLTHRSANLILDGLFAVQCSGTQLQLAELIDLHAPQLPLQHKFVFSCAPVSLDKPHEVDYFLGCLNAFANRQRKKLPQEVQWLRAQGPQHLERAEKLGKDISLYAWLAFKFPACFVEGELVPEFRHSVSRYIERALLVQAGYGEITREMYAAGTLRH